MIRPLALVTVALLCAASPVFAQRSSALNPKPTRTTSTPPPASHSTASVTLPNTSSSNDQGSLEAAESNKVSHGEPEVIDGIAATVNGTVITYSQVRGVMGPRERLLRQQYTGEELQQKLREVRAN